MQLDNDCKSLFLFNTSAINEKLIVAGSIVMLNIPQLSYQIAFVK